jgi:hypothetical protein
MAACTWARFVAGPILFGIGAREAGHYNLFLEIGHRF